MLDSNEFRSNIIRGKECLFKAKVYTACVFVVASLSAAPVFAQVQTGTSSPNITLFPPANVAAGGGLLFFPPNSPNSYYAIEVPVQNDQNLINATVGIGTTIASAIDTQGQQQTAAIESPGRHRRRDQ